MQPAGPQPLPRVPAGRLALAARAEIPAPPRNMLINAHPIGWPGGGGSERHLHGGGQLLCCQRRRAARVLARAGWVGGRVGARRRGSPTAAPGDRYPLRDGAASPGSAAEGGRPGAPLRRRLLLLLQAGWWTWTARCPRCRRGTAFGTCCWASRAGRATTGERGVAGPRLPRGA